MIGTLSATVCFVVALAVHVLVWRISRPVRTLRSLAAIFVAAVFVSTIATGLAGGGLPDQILSVLLLGSLGLSYLITYTGVEWDSPTMTLVAILNRAGPHGLAIADLREEFRARPFVRSRLNQLLADGIVVRQGEYLHCRAGSGFGVRLSDALRTLLGRRSMGG